MKRDIEPDEPLAIQVRAALVSANDVFIDQTMLPGTDWAAEIENQIKSCDALVLFLSEASAHSEMVRGEIELARRYKRRIIPVRVAFDGPLPNPLNAYLDPIQYATWRGASDTHPLIGILSSAVNGAPLPVSPGPAAPASSRRPPSPGGSIDLDDPFYIARPDDARARALAKEQGRTAVLVGPHQMGKTSLLYRMAGDALAVGKTMALVDLQAAPVEAFKDSDVFHRVFSNLVADAIEFDRPQNVLTPFDLGQWIQREVLPQCPTGFSLFIDEVDGVIESPFRESFFGTLRSWHNQRGNPLKKTWKRLDLFLASRADVSTFIQSEQSDWNIGEVFRLAPFTSDECRSVNANHGHPLSESELDLLYKLLGGQPFLTQKAFYELTEKRLTPKQLFGTAADRAGPFRDHLHALLLALHRMPNGPKTLRQIIRGRGYADIFDERRLESSGLVRRHDGVLAPACDVYRRYFEDLFNSGQLEAHA